MDIQVDCSCGQKFAIDKQYVGQAVACPTCGTAVIVPVPVRAAVQLERLPELKAQPTFSSYTLPPARRPSILSLYKWWIVGGLAIAVLVALVVAVIVGLVWLVSAIEPPAPGRSTQPTETQLPGETQKPSETQQPAGTKPGRVAPAAKTPINDSDDFEGDSTPEPSAGPSEPGN